MNAIEPQQSSKWGKSGFRLVSMLLSRSNGEVYSNLVGWFFARSCPPHAPTQSLPPPNSPCATRLRPTRTRLLAHGWEICLGQRCLPRPREIAKEEQKKGYIARASSPSHFPSAPCEHLIFLLHSSIILPPAVPKAALYLYTLIELLNCMRCCT